jgi:YegS/Rv2252/BmrU family lipid kinase
LDSYYSIHVARRRAAKSRERFDVTVVAIINPISGSGMDRGVAARRVALLRDELSRRALRGEIQLTERAGHAADLAGAARDARADLAIVWGGDGTLNEAGGALVGSDTVLGIIPAGSGNGLAHALGLPRDPAAALGVALDGRTRRIDAGVIGGRYFLNVAGIGVDARIAFLFNQRARGSRGRWPYISIGVTEGCRYVSRDYRVELDGEDGRHHKALLIAFANGREYGMGALLAPRAELDDGRLDAFVIEDRSVGARFWDARHLIRGTVDRAPGVVVRSVRTAAIESLEPIEFHVDGEPAIATGRLDVQVLPGALLVRC